MKKAVKVSLIVFAVIAAVIALAIGFFFLLIEPSVNIFGLNNVDEYKLTSVSRTVTVLDADGKPIDDARYDINKIYVSIDELPSNTVNAFIAIEDKRFYKHNGVDYKRICSALLSNLRTFSFREGASTITQQLIKNTHLSNKKTIKRKINEMRMARQLERKYTKQQILESYFNILYFGSGIRGLGTASKVMFDRPASQLTLAQSAALASIINNPSKYSPYNNLDNLNKRKKLVLKQMMDQGYITRAEYNSAVSEDLVFCKNNQNQFINGVIKNACESLNCTEKELFINNYTIATSYDPYITEAAHSALQSTVGDYTMRVLVLDNKSGGIVCDESNCTKYINPMRSPASTVKPFVSYATALENGYNSLSQINDEPTSFGDYAPSNYKNVYRGYISLKECLAYSSNIAAVKLLRDCGISEAKGIARSFGIKFGPTDDSLAIALGGMEHGLTLIDIANAYRTLANGGIYSDAHYVNAVSDGNRTVYKRHSMGTRAVGDDTAYILTDMLRECARHGTAKSLKYDGQIAAKTGTNGDENGNYDCYCIAYTTKYTIAVWFGSNEQLISNNITGASCCKTINKLLSSGAIGQSHDFVMPDSVAYFDIDGQELTESHEVYLADPLLPKRYRQKALLSKRFLPIRKNIDILDFYDGIMWE